MSDNNDFEAENDIFELDMSDGLVENNKRTAVRYVRPDITPVLIKKGLFKTCKILVQLIDISSKGATIICADKIKVKTKVTLNLTFKDDKKFVIPSTVVHIEPEAVQWRYGLKFDSCNDKLGDYLLSSQNDLIFK